jgi:hypothetical protein
MNIWLINLRKIMQKLYSSLCILCHTPGFCYQTIAVLVKNVKYSITFPCTVHKIKIIKIF